MTASSRKIGYGIVVALVVLILGAGVFVARSRSAASQGSANQPATASATPSASPTTPPASTTPSAEALTPKEKLLTTQVTQFLEAYYRLEPGDTAKTRSQRVRQTGLVPAATLSELDFAVATGTEADNARIRDGYILQATVLIDPESGPIAEPIDETDPNTLEVHVSVTVDQLWPDKHIVQGGEIPTTSTWEYKGDKWNLWNFSDEG